MRIAINTLAPSKVKAGVGNYVANLVRELSLHKEHEFTLFVGSENASWFAQRPNLRLKVVRFWNRNRMLRLFWEQYILPFHLRKSDVLFAPGFAVPLFSPCPSVVTIHDLTFFSHPKLHRLFNRWYYRLMIPFAVRRAKKVIAVSQSTKSDLMRLLRVPGRKVEVVYEAAAKRTPPKKYSVERPYILFVGMLEPRKNIPRLLEAFARLPDAYDLIIVGKKGWKFDQVFATHNRLSLRGRVHFEGYASDTRLAQLYANASVFVYPSLYEGFGLPVLEAMQAGCPVITSNISSLPEVAGDAAILVDPYSVKSITDALYTVLSNKSLQRDLIIKGKKQAKKFSWKKAAKETLEVFEQCVKK